MSDHSSFNLFVLGDRLQIGRSTRGASCQHSPSCISMNSTGSLKCNDSNSPPGQMKHKKIAPNSFGNDPEKSEALKRPQSGWEGDRTWKANKARLCLLWVNMLQESNNMEETVIMDLLLKQQTESIQGAGLMHVCLAISCLPGGV